MRRNNISNDVAIYLFWYRTGNYCARGSYKRNEKKSTDLLIEEVFEEGSTVIMRCLKEGKKLESEIEKVHQALRMTRKVNKQV